MPKFSKRIKKCKGAKKELVKDEDSGKLNISSITTSEDNLNSEIIRDEDSTFGGNKTYDDLLRTLAPGRDLVAAAFKKRKREEEGHSESEDDGSGSSQRDNDGNGEESPSSSEDDDWDGTASTGLAEKVEDSGMSDEEIGLSDSDEEHDLTMKEEPIYEASSSSRIFNCQWGHKVSEREVAELLKKKWSYKWEVPAHGIQHCRWKGTGERFKVGGWVPLSLLASFLRHLCDILQECKCFLIVRRYDMKEIDVNLSYGLKPRLYKHWLDICKASGCTDFHSSKQRLFFSLCRSYCDILHHNKKPFYLKGQEDDSKSMDAYLMHSLNHIFTTRDLVGKNDTKWASLQESSKGDILDSDSFRDQGFTRPKILILLPLASIAYRVVKRLIQLTPAKHKVVIEHLDRFNSEFGSGIVEDNDKDDIDSSEPKKSSKPVDFQALFGGNNNDHFMIGIKYMGKKVKLYGDFYSSDMIVASPLGLITKIGEMEVEKEKDVNYLSSIEVLIVDHADVILMQNWSHVNTVVDHLNQIPSKNATDIMRLRQWYLDGEARFYRQTIILGSHLNPDIIGLFNHQCLNYRGKIMLACECRGVLQKIILPVRQIYQRFSAESISDVDDARFDFFTQKVFPKIKDSLQGGIMLFASSYFEFVRLRNFLKSQEASFCLVGDYTKQSDISRARVWFFNGTRKILLYTERAHFYHRYKIRAVQNLIIYSLPERKEFYPEIVNMLEGSQDMTCTVLFSRSDKFRLERIVGSSHAKRMITSEKDVFVFC